MGIVPAIVVNLLLVVLTSILVRDLLQRHQTISFITAAAIAALAAGLEAAFGANAGFGWQCGIYPSLIALYALGCVMQYPLISCFILTLGLCSALVAESLRRQHVRFLFIAGTLLSIGIVTAAFNSHSGVLPCQGF